MARCKKSLLSYILNHLEEMKFKPVPESTTEFVQTEVSDRWEIPTSGSRKKRKVTIVDEFDVEIEAAYHYEGDLLIVTPNPPITGRVYLN